MIFCITVIICYLIACHGPNLPKRSHHQQISFCTLNLCTSEGASVENTFMFLLCCSLLILISIFYPSLLAVALGAIYMNISLKEGPSQLVVKQPDVTKCRRESHG